MKDERPESYWENNQRRPTAKQTAMKSAEEYIRDQIPTIVGEMTVSAMRLSTLIGLLNGFASQSTQPPTEEEIKEKATEMAGSNHFKNHQPLVYDTRKLYFTTGAKWAIERMKSKEDKT